MWHLRPVAVLSFALLTDHVRSSSFDLPFTLHCINYAFLLLSFTAYLPSGIRESEVESLAGIKEGCEDDVEFMEVERPVARGANQV